MRFLELRSANRRKNTFRKATNCVCGSKEHSRGLEDHGRPIPFRQPFPSARVYQGCFGLQDARANRSPRPTSRVRNTATGNKTRHLRSREHPAQTHRSITPEQRLPLDRPDLAQSQGRREIRMILTEASVQLILEHTGLHEEQYRAHLTSREHDAKAQRTRGQRPSLSPCVSRHSPTKLSHLSIPSARPMLPETQPCPPDQVTASASRTHIDRLGQRRNTRAPSGLPPESPSHHLRPALGRSNAKAEAPTHGTQASM